MQVTVLTYWTSDTGANVADVILRYPGAFTDITGQPDENIPTDIDAVVWLCEVDAATLTAMEADSDLVVIVAENTDETGAVIPSGPKSANANPTAQQRTALNAWLNVHGVTGTDRAALVRAGRRRGETANVIRAWAKERPRTGG